MKNKILNINLVGAVVVLYYPNIEILEGLLSDVSDQVHKVYVIDNTPEEFIINKNKEFIRDKFPEVSYTCLGDNLGIAIAHNKGCEQAIQDNCDHVFLLDQDSEIPSSIVSELLLAEFYLLNDGVSTGALGPKFLDKKTNEFAAVIRHGKFLVKRLFLSSEQINPIAADYIISSGSLIRTDVLKKVGGMREDLFIDWVDVEWCLRASNLGFVHFVVPAATMIHDLGDRVVNIFCRKILVHNDLRNYYIVRNATALLFDFKIPISWRINILIKIPLWILLFSYLSFSTFKSLLRLLLALFHGLCGRLGRYK